MTPKAQRELPATLRLRAAQIQHAADLTARHLEDAADEIERLRHELTLAKLQLLGPAYPGGLQGVHDDV